MCWSGCAEGLFEQDVLFAEFALLEAVLPALSWARTYTVFTPSPPAASAKPVTAVAPLEASQIAPEKSALFET